VVAQLAGGTEGLSSASKVARLRKVQTQRERAELAAALHRTPKRHDRPTRIATLQKQHTKTARTLRRASGISLAKRSLGPRKITRTRQLLPTPVRRTTPLNALLLRITHNQKQ
jgi:hypothetical protein